MARGRIKVWVLMAVVAIAALGIKPVRAWWDWHHEMFERSRVHAIFARNSEIASELCQRNPDDDDQVRHRRRLVTFPWLEEPPEARCGYSSDQSRVTP